jgi:hypothetical protein
MSDIVINAPPIYIGADWTLPIYWYGTDGITPIDATGYSAHMELRPTLNSTEILADLTSSGTAAISVGCDPAFILNLSDTISASLLPGDSAVWDLFITTPSGFITRFIGGVVDIKEAVTR